MKRPTPPRRKPSRRQIDRRRFPLTGVVSSFESGISCNPNPITGLFASSVRFRIDGDYIRTPHGVGLYGIILTHKRWQGTEYLDFVIRGYHRGTIQLIDNSMLD